MNYKAFIVGYYWIVDDMATCSKRWIGGKGWIKHKKEKCSAPKYLLPLKILVLVYCDWVLLKNQSVMAEVLNLPFIWKNKGSSLIIENLCLCVCFAVELDTETTETTGRKGIWMWSAKARWRYNTLWCGINIARYVAMRQATGMTTH